MSESCRRTIPSRSTKGDRRYKPCPNPPLPGRAICAMHDKWRLAAYRKRRENIRERVPIHRPPTARQLEILAYIASCRIPPSLRDLVDRFELGSTNAAFEHIGALVRKGLLEHDRMIARGIWVTDKGREVLNENRG